MAGWFAWRPALVVAMLGAAAAATAAPRHPSDSPNPANAKLLGLPRRPAPPRSPRPSAIGAWAQKRSRWA